MSIDSSSLLLYAQIKTDFAELCLPKQVSFHIKSVDTMDECYAQAAMVKIEKFVEEINRKTIEAKRYAKEHKMDN